MTPRSLSSALALIIGLASCAPLTIYHRAGVPVAKMRSDETTCEISALQAVPPSNQIRQELPLYRAPRKVCRGDGRCRTYPGGFVPGQVYTVDVNADLRGRAEEQCMAAKGYVRVTVPNCATGTQSSAPGQTTTLPPLTPQSCAIRTSGGGWQIVSPAR